jgi:hypothetical protein
MRRVAQDGEAANQTDSVRVFLPSLIRSSYEFSVTSEKVIVFLTQEWALAYIWLWRQFGWAVIVPLTGATGRQDRAKIASNSSVGSPSS